MAEKNDTPVKPRRTGGLYARVNMSVRAANIMVAVLVVMLGEGYLADVALVYAMISFLAVVVLCKVYTGIYRERRHEEERLRAQDSGKETDK